MTGEGEYMFGEGGEGEANGPDFATTGGNFPINQDGEDFGPMGY